MFLILVAIIAYAFSLYMTIFRGLRIVGGLIGTIICFTVLLMVVLSWIGSRLARSRRNK